MAESLRTILEAGDAPSEQSETHDQAYELRTARVRSALGNASIDSEVTASASPETETVLEGVVVSPPSSEFAENHALESDKGPDGVALNLDNMEFAPVSDFGPYVDAEVVAVPGETVGEEASIGAVAMAGASRGESAGEGTGAGAESAGAGGEGGASGGSGSGGGAG